MAVTLPSIDITFAQRATSLISRSERGVAILIVREADASAGIKSYRSPAEVNSADYSASNYRDIMSVYAVKQPYRVYVVTIKTTDALNKALTIIENNVSTGWVTVATAKTPEDFNALISWIGTTEAAGKTYKAIITNTGTSPDKKHIVNFANGGIVFPEPREAMLGMYYLPSLLGLLAGSNVLAGVTYAKCSDIISVTVPPDIAGTVANGGFVLVNDVGGVYVGVGVNSLITTDGSTSTEDMKYIETVEAMDLISDDIRDEFKNNFVGKYRNSYDNQVLFISAVRDYFAQLAAQNILDPNYANIVDVDVAAQRAAWVGVGKDEAVEWTDAEVKRMTFKRTMYLTADIKILGSMEHLTFNINMA